MQPHLTSGAGSDAIASAFQNRRNFLFATAGVIACLPIAADAAQPPKTHDQPSPQEALLTAKIIEHGHIISERQKLEPVHHEIFASRPKVGVRLDEVETDFRDYLGDAHGRTFREKRAIQRFFKGKMAQRRTTPAEVQRLKADYRSAMTLFKQRELAMPIWLAANQGLIAKDDWLYDEQDRLESEICSIPCANPQMAINKAEFACKHLLPDEEASAEWGGGIYLPALLRSIAVLGTGAAEMGFAAEPSQAPSNQPFDEDSLIAEIWAYRAGIVRFEEIADSTDGRDGERHAETFGPHQERLENWGKAASSSTAAIEALRLSIDEMEERFVDGPSIEMVRAALGYLEARV